MTQNQKTPEKLKFKDSISITRVIISKTDSLTTSIKDLTSLLRKTQCKLVNKMAVTFILTFKSIASRSNSSNHSNHNNRVVGIPKKDQTLLMDSTKNAMKFKLQLKFRISPVDNSPLIFLEVKQMTQSDSIEANDTVITNQIQMFTRVISKHLYKSLKTKDSGPRRTNPIWMVIIGINLIKINRIGKIGFRDRVKTDSNLSNQDNLKPNSTNNPKTISRLINATPCNNHQISNSNLVMGLKKRLVNGLNLGIITQPKLVFHLWKCTLLLEVVLKSN